MSETVLFTVGSGAQSLTILASTSPPLTGWPSLVEATFHSGKSIRRMLGKPALRDDPHGMEN